MQRRMFGPTGREVAVIGMGTWYFEQADRAAAIAALRRGLDLGMDHIDTAEMYGSGAAEELVGEAIAGRRDEVFLVSKVLPHNASRSRHADRLRALARPAAHRPARLLPAALARSAPARGDDRGIRGVAARRQDPQLGGQQFRRRRSRRGPGRSPARGRIACNQVLYHLLERGIEHAVIPWCEQHNAAVVAYSPFGHARFPGPQTAGGRVLAEIAPAHRCDAASDGAGLSGAASVGVRHPQGRRPRSMPRKTPAAGDLHSRAEEIARIDAAFPLRRRQRGLPML